MRVDGLLISTGYEHKLVLSRHPYGENTYIKMDNVYMDDNLEEISDNMISLFKRVRNPIYISVSINEQIYGLSYEMCLVLLLCGHSDVCATGVIKSISDDEIRFGSVLGLKEKKIINKNVLTSMELPSVANKIISL